MYNGCSYNWCDVQIGGCRSVRWLLGLSMNDVQWVVQKADFLCWSMMQKSAIAELIRLKLSLHQMKERVLPYSCQCFSDMRLASLWTATATDGPQPPL